MQRQIEIEALLTRFSGINVAGLDFLVELALDLSWYWDHSADEIWQKLDIDLWEETHNPWVVLKTVSFDVLKAFLSDQDILHKISYLKEKRRPEEGKRWFHENYTGEQLTQVAYFSMEFMLSEALPIYSGGLGNVAGDQLKAANDLGIPVVGVGLLYQRGYFRQLIGRNGEQREIYIHNDPGQLPIVPLRLKNGEWLRLKIEFSGHTIWIRCWEVQVGQVRLVLLDSNDVANFPAHRGITSELYGGGSELRLQQEIILGIGGWRLLEELDIVPQVCHLNEGHSAFVLFERARYVMQRTGQPFAAALAISRAGNLFTTHTAVPAGFDHFSPQLIEQYLGRYADKELGISLQELLGLGRLNPQDSAEPFNMAYLAIKGSGAVNGVSKLHGQVSRELFQPLFPRWPRASVPISHVTNGVHMRSWDSEAADALWTKYCGKSRWMGETDQLDEKIHAATDEELWAMRAASRNEFVAFVRKRMQQNLAASGASYDEIAHSYQLFDPYTLTIGFARRFASYKRPTLLLQNRERLRRILSNSARPVQLVIAGKAHPSDPEGHAMIKEWVAFSREEDVRSRVVFLPDYDMYVASRLVQGVDVWMNHPRRPWEASGTSGMKVLVNGGLNLSELDGWWDEAYQDGLGWALGDRQSHENDPNWDGIEAERLYDLLENEIIPEFYNRDTSGIPRGWTAKIRKSMSLLTPRYSTNRTLIEYVEKYYLPAAAAVKSRMDAFGEAGSEIMQWKRVLHNNWQKITFGELIIEKEANGITFKVGIDLCGIMPEQVIVELYADGIGDSEPTQINMERESFETGGKEVMYATQVDTSRDQNDYTIRIKPYYEGVSVPLEENLIRWHR
nr:alpha-glucan family phosphorylase [Cytophagales bacterium]